MKFKKEIAIISLLAVLVGAGIVGYSWQQKVSAANAFSDAGYILVAEPEAQNKQVIFQAGATWENSLTELVRFEDVQGNPAKVSQESFAHYDNRGLSSLKSGVVVDLNDVQTAQVTNHYAVSPMVLFEEQGDAYALANTQTQLQLSDFLWKLSDQKYMVVSSGIQVHFAEDDVREAGDYLEFSFIDEGVVQLQTQENLWQTASSQCYAVLGNGGILNFSLSNVQDASGEILMDLSKIVLGADDNVQLVPAPEDLLAEQEIVIPKFDITAESGADGAAGTLGVVGESGVGGTIGVGGTAGSNGGAGSSGTNGSGGGAGSSGSSGNTGTSAPDNDHVLNFPQFTLKDWSITATSCAGTILVSDKGKMLKANTPELASCIYLVDMATNTVHETLAEIYDFDQLKTEGYAVSFANLEPDHSYRLLVAAPIHTGVKDSESYLRDFISKTFWTDSAGVYLEAGSRTAASVNLTVQKQSYASAGITAATVYLYSSLDGAKAATALAPVTSTNLGSQIVNLSSGSAVCSFPGLRSNATFFARLVVQDGERKIMPEQVLALSTLKARAAVGAPSLTPNRDSWGFDLMPGTVNDPDAGISEYRYEFYNAGDVNGNVIATGAVAAKTVVVAANKPLTVPLDGSKLQAGKGYYVRTVATFFDNEKASEIVSPFSNLGQVNGSRLPTVYFANTGDYETQIPDTAAELSQWYDQLYGVIMVAPATDGAKLLLDATHHPMVTIRASGYYYVQLPVYTRDTVPTDHSAYLVGEVLSGGYLKIELPNKALTAAVASPNGAVNGLRPNTQYRILLKGDLTEDGTNAYDTNVLVGTCTVMTPETVPLQVSWNDDTAAGGAIFRANVKFAARTASDAPALGAYKRQIDTLYAVKLTLTGGLIANPGKTIGTVTLTEANFRTQLPDFEEDVKSLGDLMEQGLLVSEELFKLTAPDLQSYSAVHLTVSQVNDYTTLSGNRVNQKAYASNESESDTTPPDSASADGAVYVNEYKLLGASHEIQLRAAPDPIPDAEKGLTVQANDENHDSVHESYALLPNYLNSGKLARSITFYAFDYPDFHRTDYLEADWRLDDASFPENPAVPLTAVSAVDKNTGLGTWLAKVTVPVASDGKMPSVLFAPKTLTAYYTDLYPTDVVTRDALIAAYVPGMTKDSKGRYLFFFDQSHQNEPSTGHQFVFSWTLNYMQEGSTEVMYYPFAMSAYQFYRQIPHAKPQDEPRRKPIIYAMPYDSAATGATWGLHVYDPDHALVSNAWNAGSSTVPLYDMTSLSTGTQLENENGVVIQTPVQDLAQLAQISDLFAAGNLVALPARAGVSTNVGMRIQWYTDKYTKGDSGLFQGVTGNPQGYKPDISKNSVYAVNSGGTYLIPYYQSTLNYYHDPKQFRDTLETAPITVSLRERTVGGSSTAVSQYQVTVEGPTTTLALVNGIRLTFRDPATNTAVVMDKYLADVDGSYIHEPEPGKTHCEFFISLSGELGDLAGKQHIALSAAVLFESGPGGLRYANTSDTVSVRSHAVTTVGGVNRISPVGSYRFARGGRLENVLLTETWPHMGGFFHINSDAIDSMFVSSTRNSRVTTLEERMQFDATVGLGLLHGNLSVEPMLLQTSGISALAVWDSTDKKLNPNDLKIPKITPLITYISPSFSSNSLGSTFYLTGTDTVWFLLERYEDKVWKIQSPVEGGWQNDTSGATYQEPTLAVLKQPSVIAQQGAISYSALLPDTTYRVTGFYQDPDAGNAFKVLNMFNSQSKEVPNVLQLTTSSEPKVNLNVNYDSAAYFYKRITTRINIEQVLNFYYTVELQDESGTFLTYLDKGDSKTVVDNRQNLYDVGGKSSTPNVTDTQRYHGAVFFSNSFDAAHELLKTEERVYLGYGQKYQVRVRVYNVSKGPAYGGTVADDLVRTEAGAASVCKPFTVKNTTDEMNLTGVYQLLSTGGGGGLVPTITFDTTYLRRSATLRQDWYTAMVVRARTNADTGVISYEDVTRHVIADGTSVADEPLNLNRPTHLRLSDDAAGLFQKGDQFTCYLYAIVDDLQSTTTQGIHPPVTRDDLLAGRGLGAEQLPLSEKSVPVENGTSMLAGSKTVIYTTDNTSAGTVSITKSDNSFLFRLNQPVDQKSITHMVWSVVASYTSSTVTGVQSVSVMSGNATAPQAPVEMQSVGTNVYQIAIQPTFATLPADAEVVSYTVSLQFYKAIHDADGVLQGYDSSGISILPDEQGEIGQVDGGTRLTVVLRMDTELDAVALLTDAELETPEEVAPPDDGEKTPATPPVEAAQLPATPPVETTPPEEGETPPATPEEDPAPLPPKKEESEHTQAPAVP